MFLFTLTLLTGCGIDSSSLGASASIPNEPEVEVTEEPVDDPVDEDVEVNSEQIQLTESDGEDRGAKEVKEEEQLEEEAEVVDEEMVWLSRTGKCYHSKRTCSNMKDPIQVPLSEVLRKNKTACTKCYN